MASVNRVFIVGHLGQDPELRFTSTGTPHAKLSVATTSVWKDKAGTRQEETTWHRVAVWNRAAETCGEYLRKGRQVCVEGALRRYKFKDKESGQERWASEIRADRVHFLSSGAGAGAGDASDGGDRAAPQRFSDQMPAETGKRSAGDGSSTDPHDDIPF